SFSRRTIWFLLLPPTFKLESFAPSCPSYDRSMILATKYEEVLAGRPISGAIPPMKRKALQTALLRIASAVEHQPSPTRWIWIVPGIMIVFALLIGVNDWLSQREQSVVTTKLAQPT